MTITLFAQILLCVRFALGHWDTPHVPRRGARLPISA
jgi:hypothetical protein